MQDTTTAPINYAYLSGALEGMLLSLSYTLAANKIVPFDKADDVREFVNAELKRIKETERKYTCGG